MPKTTIDAIPKILIVSSNITTEISASTKKNPATIYNAMSERIFINT